ncbi:antifungal protein ginkbilobin-like protein [Punica granatum]|uniref:Antifungal protein ginkbilobin-like protein n=1 Tax=Punica granatum TaxID=22663 RepID=A0A218W5Q5_PUNGR|nr:antifungal protein ginkbilobin-like protein [Punica granatum]OWM67818.1 hypothetical protein CDL15_Pgr010756 [Punica granatum]
MAALLRTLFLIIALLCITNTVVLGDPDTTLLSYACNPNKISGRAAKEGQSYTLQLLVLETPKANTYDYGTDTSGWYGHGNCNTALSSSDCRTCMDSARTEIGDNCPLSDGAQVKLQDCKLRYENHPF